MIVIRIFKLSLFALFCLIFISVVVAQDGKSKSEIRRECRALLKSAAEMIESDSTENAMILLDSALKLDNKNPDAYYYKGNILIQSGDTAKAIELLTEGIEKAPRSTRLKLDLAHLQIKHNMLVEAETILDEILAIKPNESEALYHKGTILMLNGDSATAIDNFEKGIDQIHKKR